MHWGKHWNAIKADLYLLMHVFCSNLEYGLCMSSKIPCICSQGNNTNVNSGGQYSTITLYLQKPVIVDVLHVLSCMHMYSFGHLLITNTNWILYYI